MLKNNIIRHIIYVIKQYMAVNNIKKRSDKMAFHTGATLFDAVVLRLCHGKRELRMDIRSHRIVFITCYSHCSADFQSVFLPCTLYVFLSYMKQLPSIMFVEKLNFSLT